MNINQPGARLLRAQHHAVVLLRPIRCAGNRIPGHHPQVACLHQIIQGLRRGLLVERVVIDRLTHGLQILLQRRFFRALDGFLIQRSGHADQNEDDGDDNHQLDEGESGFEKTAAAIPWRTRARPSLQDHGQSKSSFLLPVRILRPIQCRTRGFRVDVEHILAAPACGIGIILHCAQSPFRAPGHGVNRNLSQKANLPIAAGAELHSLHQRFQVRWIAFAADLHADLVPVGRVFVAVDGVPHFAEVLAKFRLFLSKDRVLCDGQRRRGQNQQDRTGENQLQKRHARFGGGAPPGDSSAHSNVRQHRSHNYDYGWTCTVASLVTSGIGFCCESLAFTCTIDRFDEPGASALITIPISVPLPFTPGVFGWRVAEMMAWPCSLSTRCTMAISWVPPERNPPCCTSSTLRTAGLYCSSIGIEKRSFTFSTTTPKVAVCPAFRDRVCGSKRIFAGCASGAGPVAGAAAPGTFIAGGTGCCGVAGGCAAGARISRSRLTWTFVSEPEYTGRRFAFVHSGIRTIRGISTIRTSFSW